MAFNDIIYSVMIINIHVDFRPQYISICRTLSFQVQDLITALRIGTPHQILSDDQSENITIYPFAVEGFEGACIYLLVKNSMHLLHTGSNASIKNVIDLSNKITTVCSRIDYLYVDTALYFPGTTNDFKKNIGTQEFSYLDCTSFILSHVLNATSSKFITIRFYYGMETFLLKFIQDATHFKVGMTSDLYESYYSELHTLSDRLFIIDHLDSRNLSCRNAKVYFYTQISSDFDHIYSYDVNHIKLEFIYDYHSSVDRVEGYSSNIYQKNVAFRVNENNEQDLTYYALYPTHLTTPQVKTLINLTKPDRIFGLSRAPGVGYTELKVDFMKKCEEFTSVTKKCS